LLGWFVKTFALAVLEDFKVRAWIYFIGKNTSLPHSLEDFSHLLSYA
jgi:hypothetical protein